MNVHELRVAEFPPFQAVVEIASLAESWLTMAQATTLDEIEAAALQGLVGLTNAEAAYTARCIDRVWTVNSQLGLRGDIAGVAMPEERVAYSSALRSCEAACYEDTTALGAELAQVLTGIGVGSLYAVPITRADLCVGALVIGRRGPSTFSPRDRAVVKLFTSHLSALTVKRELMQSLETLAQAVPAIVFRADPSGSINWYNRRWYEFTGQTVEEAAGWGWQTAHHPEDFPRVMEAWPRALATGQSIEIECRIRRYDGVYHWFLARMEPVKDDTARAVSWYGSVVDIEAQKQALERSQRVVETLQHAFLPLHLPQRSNVRLDATYISAESDSLVGGDWYDAFELPDGRLGFSIGDVTGHGLAASLVVGKLRQAIFTLALRMNDPAGILAEANRILRYQEPDMLVTALVGFIDSSGETMSYASAGHPPPVVAYGAAEPAKMLPLGGIPLGLADDLILSTHRMPVRKDMVVALYTDGVTECGRDLLDGEARLLAAVPSLVGNAAIERPARTLYQAVVGGLAPRDDAAVLVLLFSPVGALPTESIPMMLKRCWRFHASDAQAAHVARREVAAHVRRICGDTDQTFETEVIVGELLANTVVHAPGLVEMTIDLDGEPVLIVRDSGPGLIDMPAALPLDPMDERGRGLFLIHMLSAGVTVAPSPSGGAEIRVLLPLDKTIR